MNEHPIKTPFAIVTGSYFGIKYWITGTHVLDIPDMFTAAAFLIFIIACCKAVIIGCCSWAGASIAGFFKKTFIKAYKNYKNKE